MRQPSLDVHLTLLSYVFDKNLHLHQLLQIQPGKQPENASGLFPYGFDDPPLRAWKTVTSYTDPKRVIRMLLEKGTFKL